jgi:hypothetical protein
LSRERNGKIILNQQQPASRNFQVGSQHIQNKEPVKLMNVYGNINQKRQAARNMLNKKSSEETLHNKQPTNILNNNRKQLEQRYRSHARGSEVPSSINKNPSRPTLELPSIHGTIVKNESLSRNEIGGPSL